MRKVGCVWEHNGEDSLLYAVEFPGAFARGATREAALQKMEREVRSFLRWCGSPTDEPLTFEIVQEAASGLDICDADSDVLFVSETGPLSQETYRERKALALRSARDFQALYDAVPEKDVSGAPPRRTFYGPVPRTASEMYAHVLHVNAYYFGEIGVDADNDGTILDCRLRGFAALEALPGYLENRICHGSYGEDWTLSKLLRRFVWHDRIHAKALWRMAVRTFGASAVPDVFGFGREPDGGTTDGE